VKKINIFKTTSQIIITLENPRRFFLFKQPTPLALTAHQASISSSPYPYISLSAPKGASSNGNSATYFSSGSRHPHLLLHPMSLPQIWRVTVRCWAQCWAGGLLHIGEEGGDSCGLDSPFFVMRLQMTGNLATYC